MYRRYKNQDGVTFSQTLFNKLRRSVFTRTADFTRTVSLFRFYDTNRYTYTYIYTVVYCIAINLSTDTLVFVLEINLFYLLVMQLHAFSYLNSFYLNFLFIIRSRRNVYSEQINTITMHTVYTSRTTLFKPLQYSTRTVKPDLFLGHKTSSVNATQIKSYYILFLVFPREITPPYRYHCYYTIKTFSRSNASL